MAHSNEERRFRRMAARPVFYGPLARWADRRAARTDADHDIYGSPLGNADDAPAALQLVPPYVSSLKHRFGEQANVVRYCLQELIKSLDAERVIALEQITVFDHRLSQVRAQLDAFPVSAPPEMLTRQQRRAQQARRARRRAQPARLAGTPEGVRAERSRPHSFDAPRLLRRSEHTP